MAMQKTISHRQKGRACLLSPCSEQRFGVTILLSEQHGAVPGPQGHQAALLATTEGSPNLPQCPFWGLAWGRSIASNLPGSLGSGWIPASAPWHPLRGRSF